MLKLTHISQPVKAEKTLAISFEQEDLVCMSAYETINHVSFHGVTPDDMRKLAKKLQEKADEWELKINQS